MCIRDSTHTHTHTHTHVYTYILKSKVVQKTEFFPWLNHVRVPTGHSGLATTGCEMIFHITNRDH